MTEPCGAEIKISPVANLYPTCTLAVAEPQGLFRYSSTQVVD